MKSVYLNLEDDVSGIVARINREKDAELVLVCPKRCFLFSDAINLRLLKKQTDLLGKQIWILTMDERGQLFAEEAGFSLKFLPSHQGQRNMSDISRPVHSEPAARTGKIASAVEGFSHLVKTFSPKSQAPVAIQSSDTVFPRELLKKSMTARKKTGKKKIVFSLAGFLILVLLLLFVILPKADIAVYIRSQPITRDIEVNLSSVLKDSDPLRLTMPAANVTTSVDVKDKFVSQGKKEIGNRASGTVRIYNFTKQTINLKAATTILSVGDKNYLLASDAMQIRPTIYKNAKTKEVDEKSLSPSVAVIASTGGESYNLPAGTRMEISNQVFGSKPQLLYAKIDSAITGGTTRYLSVISEKDLNDAKNSLTAEAIDSYRKQLLEKDQVLPDKAFVLATPVFTSEQPVGTETPNFNAELKAQLIGLAFSEVDLKKLIITRISQTLPSNRVLLDKDIQQFNYQVKIADLNNGLLTLAIHFEGKATINSNFGDIAGELAGKTELQAREILQSKTEIERIDMTIAPAWQKTLPWLKAKIKVSFLQ